jgi:hypothetical protein
MQGNIETVRAIATQTAEFAIQDRQAKLSSLMAQFESLDGIVEGQEAQLIEQRKEQVAAEIRDLEFTRNLTFEAINSGVASVEEMQQLTRTDVTDQENNQ